MTLCGGLDLGGTKVQAVVVGPDDDVLGQRAPADADDRRPRRRRRRDGPCALRGRRTGRHRDGRARRCRRGLTGAVDDAAGTVAQAGNLPDWIDAYPLRDVLADALGAKVRLGNDVQVATDAELALGAARDCTSLLGVFWGTGIGGGIVIEGRPLDAPAAGELGHIVVRMGGRRCPCGRRGCLEAYAGRASLERRARKLSARGEHTDLFGSWRSASATGCRAACGRGR